MSKKSSSQALATRSYTFRQEQYVSRTNWMSLVLIFCAMAKSATAALYDLGAIAYITGDPGIHLAVESGLGRFCLIVGMLLFVGGGFGFNIKKNPSDKTIHQITMVNLGIALVCVASAIWGIVDGHHILDIIASFIGAIAAAYLAYCSRQVKSF